MGGYESADHGQGACCGRRTGERVHRPDYSRYGRFHHLPRDQRIVPIEVLHFQVEPYGKRELLPPEVTQAGNVACQNQDAGRQRIPSDHEERAVIETIRCIEGRGDAAGCETCECTP